MIYLILFSVVLLIANLLSFQEPESARSAFLLGVTVCNFLFLMAFYFISRHNIKNKG